ncbi:MAG: LysR family transcriptional regulator [Ferrimonas sp.]
MFNVVAKLASISQAALILDISQSALSRRIKNLEQQLNTVLFTRSGNGIQITPQGKRFYETSQKLVNQYEQVVDEISSEQTGISGPIALSVSHPMSRWISTHILMPFIDEYPNVNLELISTNPMDMSSMDKGDIMISPIPPTDPTLVVKCKFNFKRYFCAAPSYIAQHGLPFHPIELSKHKCITNGGIESSKKQWQWHHHNGQHGHTPIEALLTTDSIDIATIWLQKGYGITSLPAAQIAYHRQQGIELEVLFNREYFQHQTLYVIYRSRDFISARHRLIMDKIVAHFKQQTLIQ